MILVTGATGFIGREVVGRLLIARRPVVALARGSDGAPAGERVVAAVGGFPRGAHLEVVEGELTFPGCQLAPSDSRRLRATVETVITARATRRSHRRRWRRTSRATWTGRARCSRVRQEGACAAGRTSRPRTCAGGGRGRSSSATATSARTRSSWSYPYTYGLPTEKPEEL